MRPVTPQQIAALADFPFVNESRVLGAEAAFAALGLLPEEETMVQSGNATHLFPAFAGRCCGCKRSIG